MELYSHIWRSSALSEYNSSFWIFGILLLLIFMSWCWFWEICSWSPSLCKSSLHTDLYTSCFNKSTHPLPLCIFTVHCYMCTCPSHIPLHLLASGCNENPLLHEHLAVPGLFWHVCSHPPLLTEHSLISAKMSNKTYCKDKRVNFWMHWEIW